MEHLALGWVLLLSTLASALATSSKRDLGPVKEVAMDMANNTFDDQYQGCSRMMEDELEELNRTEFTNNIYAEGWRNAAMEWRNRWGRADRPPALRRDQATAMLAYTMEGKLYHRFNNATREDGISRQHYLRSFPFKTLHFLLSRALCQLGPAYNNPPHFFGSSQNQFASVALPCPFPHRPHLCPVPSTGMVQLLCSNTYKSVYNGTSDQSLLEQSQVLIPTFDYFEVTNFAYVKIRTLIHLRSQVKSSTYNCELLKGKGCWWGGGEQGAEAQPWAALRSLHSSSHGWRGSGDRFPSSSLSQGH
uniref:NAD(P)(+)--arginine ADP-ribosyltransferase n=1 Tax=Pavo cristatus TaxID=9049 RepID=A0A8C9EKL1_PAVCR